MIKRERKRGFSLFSWARRRFLYAKGLVIALSLFSLLSLPYPVAAKSILLNDYRKGLSKQWEEKSFKGHTRYEVTQEGGEWFVQATSKASASGLYYRVTYDPKEYPFLAWRWKVKNILSKGDARKKDGDDYPARVYVVFSSFFFWNTKAINYIWANRLPAGQAVPNAFTSNAMMIALQSGPGRAGEWVEEKRNVLEDYRKLFGEDPPKVSAVAIMTDTDNTGEEATAWYGPIRILAELP